MRNGEKRRVRLAFVVLVLLTGIMHMLGLYNVLEAAVVITQRFIIFYRVTSRGGKEPLIKCIYTW